MDYLTEHTCKRICYFTLFKLGSLSKSISFSPTFNFFLLTQTNPLSGVITATSTKPPTPGIISGVSCNTIRKTLNSRCSLNHQGAKIYGILKCHCAPLNNILQIPKLFIYFFLPKFSSSFLDKLNICNPTIVT